MKQLGFYAVSKFDSDSEPTLLRFEHGEDNSFSIIHSDGKIEKANVDDYNIFEIGVITADTK